jgi:drug/metabolite transporter (DMT)-like permease
LTDQQKGSLLAFVAVMFITPDSLFIRLSNIDTLGLVFYRGIIPFVTVLLGMLIIYKLNFFKMLFTSGYHGIIYILTFSLTNITFVVSIQNTNVANTLVMIAMAPMLSAILGAIFLKELPDKKTWIAIFVTFGAAGTRFLFLADLIVTAPMAKPKAVIKPKMSPKKLPNFKES